MRSSPRTDGLLLLLFLLSHAWPRVHSKGGKKAGDNRCAVLGKEAEAGGYGLGQTIGARRTRSHTLCASVPLMRVQHLRGSRRR